MSDQPENRKIRRYHGSNNFLALPFDPYHLTISQFKQIVFRYFSTRASFFGVRDQWICQISQPIGKIPGGNHTARADSQINQSVLYSLL